MVLTGDIFVVVVFYIYQCLETFFYFFKQGKMCIQQYWYVYLVHRGQRYFAQNSIPYCVWPFYWLSSFSMSPLHGFVVLLESLLTWANCAHILLLEFAFGKRKWRHLFNICKFGFFSLEKPLYCLTSQSHTTCNFLSTWTLILEKENP